jgi:hypothetical protein
MISEKNAATIPKNHLSKNKNGLLLLATEDTEVTEKNFF